MLYGFTAQKIISWLKTNPRTINTISACALIIIAIVIAYTNFWSNNWVIRYSGLTVVIFFESCLMLTLIIIKGENNEKNS